jgi:hypothetical protein
MFDKKLWPRLCAALMLLALWPWPAAAFAADSVQITNAWVRGTVSGQGGTGAYMDILSDAPGRILSAASPVAASVEIHNMKMENGVMRMSPVKDIVLEPGKTVRFAPGGYHVMLMGLKEELKKGGTVPITLSVEGTDKKVRQVEIKAEIRDLAGGAH